MSPKHEIQRRSAFEPRTVLTGALLGAGAGLLAALLLRRRAHKKERESTLTITEGIKVAVLVFGLLRAISALGDDD